MFLDTLTTRAEYRKERNRLMNLPLSELMIKPNCEFDCPKGKPFCCGCERCASERGFWLKDEQPNRFTKAEIEKINLLWDEITGFFREGIGCIIAKVLGREYMPEPCLRFICNRYSSGMKK